jgi:hypothetical protein
VIDRKRRPLRLVIHGRHLVGMHGQVLSRSVRVVVERHGRVLPHGDPVAFVCAVSHRVPSLRSIAVIIEGVPRAVAAAEITTEEDAQRRRGGTDDSCLELELGPDE